MRVLQGRVIIREELGAEFAQYKNIVLPDVLDAEKRHKDNRARARKFHVGTVIAMGPPAETRRRPGGRGGVPVLPEFRIGDRVVFHWVHLEKSWTFTWPDGERVAMIPQECVDAVVER
jgi:hypothetical protein